MLGVDLSLCRYATCPADGAVNPLNTLIGIVRLSRRSVGSPHVMRRDFFFNICSGILPHTCRDKLLYFDILILTLG